MKFTYIIIQFLHRKSTKVWREFMRSIQNYRAQALWIFSLVVSATSMLPTGQFPSLFLKSSNSIQIDLREREITGKEKKETDKIASHRGCVVLSSRPLSLQSEYVQIASVKRVNRFLAIFDLNFLLITSAGCCNPHKRAQPRRCIFAGWAWSRSLVDSLGLLCLDCACSWVVHNDPCDLVYNNHAG